MLHFDTIFKIAGGGRSGYISCSFQGGGGGGRRSLYLNFVRRGASKNWIMDWHLCPPPPRYLNNERFLIYYIILKYLIAVTDIHVFK